MNEIVISIIVPVYNVEKYIDECLSSIVKQVSEQIKNKIEVILVNDGSNDDSRNICEDYCKRYEYFSIYDQENKGLSAARNKGAMLADGRYLFFLDSDDYLTEVFKDLFDVVKNTNKDIVLGKRDCYLEQCAKYIYSKMDYCRIKNSFSPMAVFEELCREDFFWFTVPMILIKRNFFLEKNLLFKEGIFHEDELWVPEIFLNAETIEFFNKSIYCYRMGRPNSIVNSYNIKKEFDKLIIADEFNYIINSSELSRKSALKERMAVLEWAVIQQLGVYKGEQLIKELKIQTQKRIKYLKYGKYTLAYYVANILGIEAVRLCNIVRVKIHNKIKNTILRI